MERLATGHILVIGGGIAGIAAALRARAVDTSCHITIADAAACLGGKIAGEIADGCVIDGGADVCIGSKLRATHMFQLLRLAEHVVQVNPRRLPTYERRGSDLIQSPTMFDGELLTFASGMHELVTRAAGAMSDTVFLANTEVCTLSRRGNHWVVRDASGAAHKADSIIVALPAAPAAALLRPISTEDADVLAMLAYPATTTVSLAWQSPEIECPMDGTGYLVPDGSGLVSACTWTSSKNPSHAAPGVTLVRCYLRGCHADAADIARAEVAAVLGATGEPFFTRVYEWAAGIPMYTAEHATAVRRVEAALAEWPGIFVAGSAFHGVGIPDCIQSGELAAVAATQYLAERRQGEAA